MEYVLTKLTAKLNHEWVNKWIKLNENEVLYSMVKKREFFILLNGSFKCNQFVLCSFNRIKNKHCIIALCHIFSTKNSQGKIVNEKGEDAMDWEEDVEPFHLNTLTALSQYNKM